MLTIDIMALMDADRMFSRRSGYMIKALIVLFALFTACLSAGCGAALAGGLLMGAIAEKRTDEAKLLIERGADISEKNEKGNTPLHAAVQNSSQAITELLIAKGADVNAKNNIGDTPLHIAAGNNLIEEVELLVSAGAEVNSGNDLGKTPLHMVAFLVYDNAEEVTRFLINNGADIDAKDHYKRTPLKVALDFGNQHMIDLLREYDGTTEKRS